jgi:hypothetical protein
VSVALDFCCTHSLTTNIICSSVSDPGPVFQTLRQLYEAMEPQHFAIMVYNIVIGNQFIVQGDQVLMPETLLQFCQLGFSSRTTRSIQFWPWRRPCFLRAAAPFWQTKMHILKATSVISWCVACEDSLQPESNVVGVLMRACRVSRFAVASPSTCCQSLRLCYCKRVTRQWLGPPLLHRRATRV